MRGSLYRTFIISTEMMIIVVFVAALFFIFLSGAITTKIQEKTVESQLKTEVAANLIESCLAEGDVLTEEGLEGTRNICTKCDVCSVDQFGARVRDLQQLDSWNFGYEPDKDEEERASITVAIARTSGEVHLGVLEVSIA